VFPQPPIGRFDRTLRRGFGDDHVLRLFVFSGEIRAGRTVEHNRGAYADAVVRAGRLRGRGRPLLAGRVGRLPWRVMILLDDARRHGILRQNGIFYEFRHAEHRAILVSEPARAAR
jgi:hypothetical protein